MLMDPRSPLLTSLSWLLPIMLLLSQQGVRSLSPSLNDDVLGLIVFKADLQDPKGKLSSWNEDDDTPCKWDGVKCNPRSNRVTDLSLDGFSLTGHLGRGLLQLQFLRRLSLSGNNLTGNLLPGLAGLKSLRIVDLSENNLSGTLQEDFFKQCGGWLRSLSLAKNSFSGKIPDSLSLCDNLASLDLSSNGFSGVLRTGIWELKSLRAVDLSNNLLEGEIPKGIEVLNNLRSIDLSRNNFSGNVPDGLGSCLLLRSVDLSHNSFSGDLPESLQKLNLCTSLSLGSNLLTGEVPNWIGEMRSLETLDISRNKFSGQFPDSFGSVQSLKVLNVSGNSLSGSLPKSLASCGNILTLDFSRNMLTGDLPAWIFGSAIDKVFVSDSTLGGSVNSMSKLQSLDLSSNKFSGEIELATGALSSLQFLNLSDNTLWGLIPQTIGDMKELNVLDLSYNDLNGSIPLNIGGALSLKDLRLQGNALCEQVPTSLGNCSSLTTLVLAKNKFSGTIPAELSSLTDLEYVDLSFNNLNGTLPKQLANLPNLSTFNISHNNFQGELPAGGFFDTIAPSSISGNPSLCGAAVNKPCPAVLPKPLVMDPNSSSDADPGMLPQSLGHKRIILSISSLIAIGAAAVIVIGVIAITVLNLRVKTLTTRSASALMLSGGDDFSSSPSTDANSGKLVIFSGDLDFSAGAHALLNKDCELGRGGFGAVYKTVLRDGHDVAIKKLTVSSLVKSKDDFEREVRKLGKVRHQNVVALDGYYWTPSLQLLISEFVSGGSLYKRLHEGSGKQFLSWDERFNIILGAAKGLAQLHQLNIIHYNVKSSNVLIDSSGEAKVADFGLARLLPMLDRYVLSSKIQSALGYMAPEFACMTVKVTEKCDVYGFGALILEVVTGKRPVEYMEDDVVVLCDIVRGALEEGRVEECVDGRLQGNFAAEEAVPVMKLGLICTSQVPSNRPDMSEVVNILEMIRSDGLES